MKNSKGENIRHRQHRNHWLTVLTCNIALRRLANNYNTVSLVNLEKSTNVDKTKTQLLPKPPQRKFYE